jgi:predicted ATPase
MDKIVKKGLKIDLHIHSEKSKFKDGSKVDKNTVSNLQTLIAKLNKYQVNVCAITDHDAFDFKLYQKLKKEEGKGSIIKVFPAVEFSVAFSNNPSKPVHIICVFDDTYSAKVKKIESVLEFDEITKRPKYDNTDSFTENKFIELLGDIDLNVVCIAHQKNTLTSSQPRENDANILGEEKFNEFLFSEYFEAFEFKNRKHQVFNNYRKSILNYDLLRFITGSDCHEWSAYPKYSISSKDDDFKHTILKCLPNFKGLALALTDDSRISLDDNFFNRSKYHLDEISINIEGEDIPIPLSKGINVIIGDNSIGKSLLLHKMTNYYRDDSLSPLNETIKKGYDNYLSQHNIVINTILSQNKVFAFDTQGEIRKKFNQEKLKRDSFFKDKYPPDIDTSVIRADLIAEVNKVGEFLQSQFEYNNKYCLFGNLAILKERGIAASVSVVDCSNSDFTSEMARISSVISQITKAKTELSNLKTLLDKFEQQEVDKFLEYTDKLAVKYEKIKETLFVQLSLINCINNAFNDYKTEKISIKSTADQNLNDFIQQEKIFSDGIVDLLFAKKSLKPLKPHIETKEIVDEGLDYLNFMFIKRTMVQKFDDIYLINLLNNPFSKVKKITIDSIKKIEDLKNALKEYDDSDPIDFYKNKVIEQIDKDLTQKAIPNKLDETGKYIEYSSGLNSQIYFEVLSSDRYKDGIYLIDQPEDDVSPKSIKGHLLRNFKDMGKNRQIIMVTHNPQFVVNLDADNVIIFTRENSHIKIESGALEYQDSKTNILNQVATLLDGGIETIRKRWKRYEKDN